MVAATFSASARRWLALGSGTCAKDTMRGARTHEQYHEATNNALMRCSAPCYRSRRAARVLIGKKVMVARLRSRTTRRAAHHRASTLPIEPHRASFLPKCERSKMVNRSCVAMASTMVTISLARQRRGRSRHYIELPHIARADRAPARRREALHRPRVVALAAHGDGFIQVLQQRRLLPMRRQRRRARPPSSPNHSTAPDNRALQRARRLARPYSNAR